MLRRLAERYGALVARASVPTRRFGKPRLPLQGEALEEQADWRQSRRRGRQLRMTYQALTHVPEYDRFRDLAFSFAVIALAAKLAQVDGEVTEKEFNAFRAMFPVPESEEGKIRDLFQSASRDNSDPLVYARQVCGFFPPESHAKMLQDVLAKLVKVAAVDGALADTEIYFLRRVAEVFQLKSRVVSQLLKGHELASTSNPYALLQVKRGWNDRQIRHAYLRLVRDYHPDKIQARGGSAEAVKSASNHIALLNAAYTLICQERGLKSE